MSSLQFALLYGGLCLAQWCANVRTWRWAEGRAGGGGQTLAGGTYALAILSGGPRLAVTVAVTMLLRRGSLVPGAAACSVVVAEPPGDDAHPLERTVFEAVRRAPQVTVQALQRELECSGPVERLVSELRRDGLLIEAHKLAVARWLWLAGPLVLLALGSARLATSWDYYDDQWMRVLLIAVLWTAAFAIFHVVEQLGFDGRPLPTARGWVALERGEVRDRPARERDPDELAALAVAMKGESELWKIDPRVAAALGVPREAASTFGQPGWSCG